ncbi:MAG: DUF1272 domain-containing protein [Woeseiaceae bacterium]
MLTLKPNCEHCDRDLPPDSPDAMICTYECTFCAECVDRVLQNVCPNCGGGFERRPIRPKIARRSGVSLQHHPASTKRIHSPLTESEMMAFADSAKAIAPSDR